MKKLFRKVWMWIEKMWSKLDKEIEKLIPVATNIVQAVKKAVENETTIHVIDVIKFYIPGTTDDIILDKAVEIAKRYIPKIAIQLEIMNSITGIEDVNLQMIAVVDNLKQLNKEERSDYWHELAAKILQTLADGKITLGEAGMLAEYHYKNKIKK